MSSGDKFPLSVAGPVALKLRDMLAPTCDRIEFAGSLRRAGAGDPLIGDVELVAIPRRLRLRFGVTAANQQNDLDRLLDDMIRDEMIQRWPPELARPAWGERYKKFWLPVGERLLQVDLFLADADNWGSIFTIRTGSLAFSKALVTHIRYKTPYMQEDGYLRRQANGVIVPVPEEIDYFERAGVLWIPAVKRTGPEALVMVEQRIDETETVEPSDRSRQLSMF